MYLSLSLPNPPSQVTVPEGILPGQSINIIVPQCAEPLETEGVTVFSSVESVRDAAVLQAKGALLIHIR